MSFRGKVVWVTGASSGIGEAVAVAFSREGAQLVLSSRNTRELERVRKVCDDSDRHLLVPLDLTQSETLPGVTADVLRQVDHIDVLVHSGGVSQRSLVTDTALATDRAIMNLNYFGTVALTKAVLPSMLARKSGHIVPISSVVGYVGTPLRSAYSASKHALHGFFDSLRAEVAKDGIDITIVCPGYIRTNVTRNALTGDGSAYGKMDRSHDRAMRPEECARHIVNAVKKRKQEIVVGGKETWAVPLKRFLPRLVSRMVRLK
ncbi:MAG: SDR family oxidoreductase [Thermoanaerobaculia bacterium]